MSAALIGVLALVGLIVWLVRRPRRRIRTGPDAGDVDHDELEAAEREVRDLGTEARPEDGFEGDDWGPGAGGSGRRR